MPHRVFSGISLTTAALSIWLTGAALVLLSLALGLYRVHQLRRSALPSLGTRPLLPALANAAGVRKAVDVVVHEDIRAPFTCGVMRPASDRAAIRRARMADVRIEPRADPRARTREAARLGGAGPGARRVRPLLVPAAGLDRISTALPAGRARVRRRRGDARGGHGVRRSARDTGAAHGRTAHDGYPGHGRAQRSGGTSVGGA
jgi:hypothetical protein